jgi:hypothetical protein
VALLAGLLVALADGDFEILAEHPDLLHCNVGRLHRDGCKMGAKKSRINVFALDESEKRWTGSH